MLRALTLAALLIVTALPVTAGFKKDIAANNKGDRKIFTLYRNSPDYSEMRIHVATFDAYERADYNRTNCEIARRLFAGQQGVKVQYWCEPDRYRR